MKSRGKSVIGDTSQEWFRINRASVSNVFEFNVHGSKLVLNRVKIALDALRRSFEAQDARGAYFEPGTLNLHQR
jgi:hypothetical protein